MPFEASPQKRKQVRIEKHGIFRAPDSLKPKQREPKQQSSEQQKEQKDEPSTRTEPKKKAKENRLTQAALDILEFGADVDSAEATNAPVKEESDEGKQLRASVETEGKKKRPKRWWLHTRKAEAWRERKAKRAKRHVRRMERRLEPSPSDLINLAS
jgi:hypothetical protein